MRVVGGFLLGLIFVTNSFASSAPSDSHSCAAWINFFELQGQVARLRAANAPVSKKLWRELFDYEQLLLREDSEEAEGQDYSFLPATDWTPNLGAESDEGGTLEPERAPESTSPFFSLNRQLEILEERLSERDGTFSHEAVDAVFRRMLAAKHFKDQNYQNVFIELDMPVSSLQILSLEFAGYEITRNNTTLPPVSRVKQFASVFRMESSEALKILEHIDFHRSASSEENIVNVMKETIRSISAERLNLPPHVVVRLIKRFYETQKTFPVQSFGKLLFYLMGTRDELYSIQDSNTLDRYLSEK